MNKRRVVITGTGIISALGFSANALYQSLLDGRSAVRAMPEWQGQIPVGPDYVTAAPVELPPEMSKSIKRHYRRSMGNAALFATLAAQTAVAQSGLSAAELSGGRTGCVISSTLGSSSEVYESTKAVIEKRFNELSSCQFFRIVSHSSAFNVANFLGINGVQLSPCSACASSLQSIGLAYEQILAGRQEVFLSGGSDEVTPIVVSSFRHLYALADSRELTPQEQSRPFDARRCGLVCGEGAGIMVLEEYEYARRRNAPILAEIAGYATNCTGSQISQSDSSSIESCMRLALDDAQMSPEEVDYISAHATSTVAGDREEAAAIRAIFADRVPVSSCKGHLGHTLGASGALESAAVLEMIRHGVILPTGNLEQIADDCAGLNLPLAPVQRQIKTVLKNCIAFGGVNASLVLKTPA
ncbi:MAG: beta-ketoacyl-[acyl-carrier-protein] synthase family protein [Lentisphaerae bacterium]|nr:beta-ketoacyl-[acyl-carrier-protein] synthase family protein [Lentisphaerota bacterium]